MAERSLVDLTQAQTYTAPNGATFKLKPSSTGTLLNGPSNAASTQTSTPASSGAVAMWKASSYDGSSQFLKDTTGNGHHLRMGSQFPAYIAKGALNLPGIAGNYASTPDSAATSITGDIDVRVLHSRPIWDDSGAQPWIIGKLGGATQSYRFDLFWPMDLRLTISLDGTATTSYSASTALPNPGPGAQIALRFTRAAASGNINYYYATDFNISTGSATWQQVGTTVSSPAGGLYDSSSDTYIGHPPGSATKGTYYYAEIRNGINGDVVAKFDPSGVTDFNTSFTSITGEVWTVNQPGAIINSLGGGLVLPGTNNSYASTPSTTALSITGDLEVIVRCKSNKWAGTAYQGLASKQWAAFSWRFFVHTSGVLVLGYSTTGTSETATASASSLPFVDGTAYWMRVTRVASTGSINFYYAADQTAIPGSWTTLGTVAGTAGSLGSTTDPINVGSEQNGVQVFNGTIYRAVIQSGISGTTVFDADFTTQAAYTSKFTCTTGQTVTLNGQTGSDTNDPQFLPYSNTRYVYLPGVTNNSLSIPDNAALKITGDIDIRVKVALNSYAPATYQGLCSKFGTATSDKSWVFQLTSAGKLQLTWVDSGTVQRSADANVTLASVGITDGNAYWLRATLDVDNGSSGHDVKYWYSGDGTNWTQIGTTVNSGAFTTSIQISPYAMYIGASDNGTSSPATGKFYRVQVYNGIAGTKVADADLSQATAANTTLSDKHYLITSGALQLSGATGEYASLPDSAALSVTGNIDIQVKANLYDWTPSTTQTFVGKYTTTGNLRSYLFRLQSDGKLWLYWSPDGTSGSQRSATSSVVTGIADGTTKWVRVTLDVDNDAGGCDAKFYTSDDGSAWTQLGTTVTSAGTTSIADTSSSLYIGSWGAGVDDVDHPLGKIYQVKVLNGIDGTTVLNADFTTRADGTLSFTEESNQAATVTIPAVTNTVTITRSSSGRKAVVVDRNLFLLGTDDFMEAPDTDLLDFDAAQDYTIVLAMRAYGTASAYQAYMSKREQTTGTGWDMAVDAGATNLRFVEDGSTASPISAYVVSISSRDGNTHILTGRRAGTTMRSLQDGTVSTTNDPTDGAPSLLNNSPLRVGRRDPNYGGNYAEMEFVGAAVWRRALSDTEIIYQSGEFF